MVAFPTETVYGLAANAALAGSVQRLRDVKGRTAAQPFTVNIGRRDGCEDFVPILSPIARLKPPTIVLRTLSLPSKADMGGIVGRST